MTRTQMIAAIAADTDSSNLHAAAFLAAFERQVALSLGQGDMVWLQKFGGVFGQCSRRGYSAKLDRISFRDAPALVRSVVGANVSATSRCAIRSRHPICPTCNQRSSNL